jgi:hypothetical protein
MLQTLQNFTRNLRHSFKSLTIRRFPLFHHISAAADFNTSGV